MIPKEPVPEAGRHRASELHVLSQRESYGDQRQERI